MKSRRLQFPGAGGALLAARLDLPADEPRAYALFAHCFTCSKDLKAVHRISRTLAERGIAVFRFDFTGLGESEGDFADTDFSSNLDDLVAAAGYLREQHRAPEILIGHSLGGAAVLAAAHRIPESLAVVTLGAPSDTGHLVGTLLARAPELETEDEAEVVLAGRRFTVRRQLLDDLEEGRVQERLGSLRRALLILHSPVDSIVGIDHARRLYEGARHPKSFVSLGMADHLLTDPADARHAGAVIAAWVGRYLPQEAEESDDSEAVPAGDGGEGEEAPEKGEVVATVGASGYATELRTHGHRLRGDEPESVGGTDTGPNPYELLLAALGACKAMTVRMYADRKEWPLKGARISLKHSRIHAEDCERCETETGKIDRIAVEVGVEGEELSSEQRERLLEISERCPVHRTLTGEIDIPSSLVSSSN